MRTVRSILRLSDFRMRITSMATPAPAPLSVAPVPMCQESKWPPTITSSFGLVAPGISAITLNESVLRHVELRLDVEGELHRHVVLQQARDAVVVLRGDGDLRQVLGGIAGSRRALLAKTMPLSPRPWP